MRTSRLPRQPSSRDDRDTGRLPVASADLRSRRRRQLQRARPAGAKLVISEGATKITGDVGLGANGTGSLLKAKIDGKLFLDPTAHPDIHGDLTVTTAGS